MGWGNIMDIICLSSFGSLAAQKRFTKVSVDLTLWIGWTKFGLHFYKTIQGMLEQSSVTDLYTATPYGVIDDVYWSNGLDSGTGFEQATYPSELPPVFSAARDLACRAAIEFSKQIEEVYLISRLAQTKIMGGQLKKWIQLVVEVTDRGVMLTSVGIQTLESSASAQDPRHVLTLNYDPGYHHPSVHSDSHHVPQSGSATAENSAPSLAVRSVGVPRGAGIGSSISPYDPSFSDYTYASLGSNFDTNFGYASQMQNQNNGDL
ncbi:hypothetical protein D9758_016785 [Tetrapyrgos nigripes]|uniref:Uncharacterized protein n=1 Tax=Tetrapyrgos nigripes TaxID=182062 RepID=A0A8H5BJA1_9AGAR|nr:hypothetical protein D9758_016785 [Tetrapyrgos nigripes]